MSDVRLISRLVYPSDPDGPVAARDQLVAARDQLVRYSARLLDDGLAVGSAGNMSVRLAGPPGAGTPGAGTVAITPSGVSYAEMKPEEICLVSPDGTKLEDGNSETPSSETPMHLAIYAATGAAAVVHTHSPEVVALSAARTVILWKSCSINTVGASPSIGRGLVTFQRPLMLAGTVRQVCQPPVLATAKLPSTGLVGDRKSTRLNSSH